MSSLDALRRNLVAHRRPLDARLRPDTPHDEPAVRQGRHVGHFETQILRRHVERDVLGEKADRRLGDLGGEAVARATVALVAVATALGHERERIVLPVAESFGPELLRARPTISGRGSWRGVRRSRECPWGSGSRAIRSLSARGLRPRERMGSVGALPGRTIRDTRRRRWSAVRGIRDARAASWRHTQRTRKQRLSAARCSAAPRRRLGPRASCPADRGEWPRRRARCRRAV